MADWAIVAVVASLSITQWTVDLIERGKVDLKCGVLIDDTETVTNWTFQPIVIACTMAEWAVDVS